MWKFGCKKYLIRMNTQVDVKYSLEHVFLEIKSQDEL